MSQTQTKIQPTTKTQPTKTTTAAVAPFTPAPASVTASGVYQRLESAIKDFFKGLATALVTAQQARPTATIHQAFMTYATSAAPGVGGGTPPPVTRPTTPPGIFQVASQYITPLTSPLQAVLGPVTKQVEELKKRQAEESQFTPATPSKVMRAELYLQSLQKQKQQQAGQGQVQPAHQVAAVQTASQVPQATETMRVERTRGKTEFEPVTSTATQTRGRTASQMDIAQIPFVQDIFSLMQQSARPEPPVITNVPQGAEIQIFRDPLGGSTPFFGHIIQPGETLTKIAQRYGVSIEDILRLNRDRTDAIKSRDLIIAGKEIRIPVVQRELRQPALLGQKFVSADEINQRARENLQLPQPQIDENKLNQLILEKTGVDLSRIDTTFNRLVQLSDPNFYVNQYNQLLERTGISKDIQALADLRSIMERTKQDVLEEAAKVGGLVTESQVAEVVNFRHSILKAQYQALADVIEAKERMIDRIMKYTAMDRKFIEDLLERQLNLEEWRVKLAMDAIKWDFNAQKELRNRNLKKLENYAEIGQLHTASPDFLYHFVNPESPLYAGITVDELRFYIRMSQEKARQRELDEARKKQLIQKTLEDMQRARTREARERELHPLRKEILKKRLEKLIEEGGDTLDFNEY
jgi:LysM repeat protein